ncbi:hypothetical protein GCM10010166_53710 [Couchioplanes caeruleus subsp. azureus]|nr:hypothetical protein GCM10010166_53710 [Couchioplanes caeruleus subsp. azureus]
MDDIPDARRRALERRADAEQARYRAEQRRAVANRFGRQAADACAAARHARARAEQLRSSCRGQPATDDFAHRTVTGQNLV